MTERVLVTGISGFIGSHTACKLLEKGYTVRGTVRNIAKGKKVAAKICAQANVAENAVELVQAELTSDRGWSEAVQDCQYIQHLASPVPIEPPTDREGLVPEARAGAQRVLEHGFGAGVERIVLTSSIAAMIGQKNRPKHFRFGEQDWSDPEWKKQTAYPVSKTRAELSAWSYVETQGFKEKLTTVNPGLVFGPDIFDNGSASLFIVRSIMKRYFAASPKLAYPIIDVRDVASIHVAAMLAPMAGGRRLLATSDTLWFKDIVQILREAYPDVRLPNGEAPNGVLRFMSLFDERLKAFTADLGVFHEADNAYVTNITQVMPRPAKQAVLATAESLISSGKVQL